MSVTSLAYRLDALEFMLLVQLLLLLFVVTLLLELGVSVGIVPGLPLARAEDYVECRAQHVDRR